MEIPILHEDSDIVVVNKPAGLVVHADGKTQEATLTDWILAKFPETKDVGEPFTLSDGTVLLRPGIVHRIDRDTSGVLIVAKSAAAHAHLKEQFQSRTIDKTYHTFLYGELKEKEGTIDRPIGRSSSDFRKWSAQRGARGQMRDALTHYSVLAANKEVSYVEANPKTGRTHQIRVHFKAINHPVVGDTLYAPNHEPVLGFNRLALHARKVEFNDLSGKRISVEAPFPADFENARKSLGF